MNVEELFLWYGWPDVQWDHCQRSHHRESPTRREQDLNLRKTCVQVVLNEVVQ